MAEAGELKSPNYVPGSAGWMVDRLGTGEFQDGIFRGDIVAVKNGVTRAKLTEDSLYFYDENGVQRTRIYGTADSFPYDGTAIETAYLVIYDATTSILVLGNAVDFVSLVCDDDSDLWIQASATKGRILIQGGMYPVPTGTWNLGNATYYWLDISYKTLTDRGCLGSFDEGVEMQDGKIVSDLEAIKAIKIREDKKTIYGKPMLDYRTMPKAVFKPATDEKGNLYKRDKNDEPLPIKVKVSSTEEKEVIPQDGAEMSALISIMLGAMKELSNEVEKIKK